MAHPHPTITASFSVDDDRTVVVSFAVKPAAPISINYFRALQLAAETFIAQHEPNALVSPADEVEEDDE